MVEFWYDSTIMGVYSVKRMRFCVALLMILLLCVGCASTPAPEISFSPKTTVEVVPTSEESSSVSLNTTVTTVITDLPTTTTTSGSSTTRTDGTTSGTGSTSKRTTTTAKTTVTTTTVTTTTVTTTTTTAPIPQRPEVGKEMRGVWVSYIELAELLQKNATPAKARQALDDMMAKFADYGLTTVFFHVRANSDAYYNSDLFEPAATAAPLLKAGFDPLAYAVTAAHKNGLQLHAWVNPYRAGKNTAYVVDGIPTMTDNGGCYYYVPTSTASQKLILDGIRELLDGYAIDGIQYDDYFYPEGLLVDGKVYEFERADYEAYTRDGGKLSVADWRRAGVDVLVQSTHALTASRGVIFGISPAVDANKTYSKLYANVKKWLSAPGYVDYLCPQIYTGFEHGNSAFDDMVVLWQSYPRDASVKLYFGLALYKIGIKSDTYAGAGKTEWATHDDIMKRSVEYLRSRGVPGMAFYSYSYFTPDTKAGLSTTADVAVAKREVENLLSIL